MGLFVESINILQLIIINFEIITKPFLCLNVSDIVSLTSLMREVE